MGQLYGKKRTIAFHLSRRRGLLSSTITLTISPSEISETRVEDGKSWRIYLRCGAGKRTSSFIGARTNERLRIDRSRIERGLAIELHSLPLTRVLADTKPLSLMRECMIVEYCSSRC